MAKAKTQNIKMSLAALGAMRLLAAVGRDLSGESKGPDHATKVEAAKVLRHALKEKVAAKQISQVSVTIDAGAKTGVLCALVDNEGGARPVKVKLDIRDSKG